MFNVLSRTYAVPNAMFSLSFPLRQSSNLLLNSLSFFCCGLSSFVSPAKEVENFVARLRSVGQI